VPIVPRLAALLTVLIATALVPATAPAAEQTGRGENIKPVRNIAYPNLHQPAQVNAGTDLEFATLTVAGPAAAPGTSGAPAAAAPGAAPGTPAAAAPRATARSRAASKKAAAAKRAAAKAAKRCSAARRSARKAKSRKAKRSKTRRAKKLCSAATKARKRAKKLSRTVVAVQRAGLRDAKPEEPGVQRTFAFAGSYGDGMHIIDVTDPEQSERVATWDCGLSQADVQVFRRSDLPGRTFATLTMDGSSSYVWHKDSACVKELRAAGFGKAMDDAKGWGTYIAEITNPYEPKTISFISFQKASHNMTVHPSGRFLYNSNSDLITSPLPTLEIADITDITRPKRLPDFQLKTLPGLGTESHDVGFSADGNRAYVAALSHGEILDTSNPATPKSLATIVDPAINVWHEAEEISVKDPVLGERKFLVAEDEFAGATGTGQCPNGAVHVFDITGPLEQAPVKVGSWNITDTGPTEDNAGTHLGRCTAHVFQLHRKEQLMTIAYYNGGVRVVDLSGLVGVALGKTGFGMKELGFYRFKDSDTWAVKAYAPSRNGFYLFGNDQKRGFDVYKWTPGGTNANPGIWRTAEQTLEAMKMYRAAGGKIGLGALCLIQLGDTTRDAAARAGMTIPAI
jgi:hypothetical protein